MPSEEEKERHGDENWLSLNRSWHQAQGIAVLFAPIALA